MCTNREYIYFDNNGTTKLCKESIKEVTKWLSNYGNPSTNNILAIKSKEMIDCGKNYILQHCGTSNKKYSVIFTSGATESNCFILRSMSTAYQKINKKKPHIIISAVEHPSIMACCKSLYDNKCIELTYILPQPNGSIEPLDVKDAIQDNTCLISIMFANNETGSINNIEAIGKIAKTHKIPFHSDAVQIFGKLKLNLQKYNLGAISVSFHKLYSPLGIGLLIINNDLVDTYKLEGIINGTQQGGLRGGTESVPNIAGAIKGMVINFTNRSEKNTKLLALKNRCLEELNKVLPVIYFEDYQAKIQHIKNTYDVLFVLLGNKTNSLPNTILISLVSFKKKICNTILKKTLESKYNIIVSVGSACSTDSKNASHVLTNMGASNDIKRGVIRISFGDYNKVKEVLQFVKCYISAINEQIPFDKK